METGYYDFICPEDYPEKLYSQDELAKLDERLNLLCNKQRVLLRDTMKMHKDEKENYLLGCFPIEQYSEYEIEKMQKTILSTVTILQRKELELNKQGVYIN